MSLDSLFSTLGTSLLWLTLGAVFLSAILFSLPRPHPFAKGFLYLGALAALLASLLLEYLLLTDRFAFLYVAAHSSRATPFIYKVGALWGGQEGSLLFWLALLLLFSALLACRVPREAAAHRLWPRALAILSATGLFFALLLAVAAPPFALLPAAPADGTGLNRLLRDPAMLLHPVALYSGFVGLSIPYAFAMAGLWEGQMDASWIRLTRRASLLAWGALSLGILLGAHWAYHVLGWGGYWAFDPVENAALMPWLTATAYLHSSLVQEKRGQLQRWNVILVTATFFLTILGTFLTRSGIVTSVHSFAQSPIGGWFLTFMGIILAFSAALILWRWHDLKDRRPLKEMISKEGSFLLNNVVLLSLALTVLFGTLLPLLSPFWGKPLSVGAPYFQSATAPLFALLFLLMGIGPLLAWQKADAAHLWNVLRLPLLASALLAGILFAAGIRIPGTVLGITFAFFAMAAVLADTYLQVRLRQERQGGGFLPTLLRLVWRHPRKYGGYLVHLAIGFIALGVVVSTAFQRTAAVGLYPGDQVTVASYTFQFNGLYQQMTPHGLRSIARLDVTRGGKPVAILEPALFTSFDEAGREGPNAEIALRQSLIADLYVVFLGYDDASGQAGFKIYVNPMVGWIWLGGLLLVAGTLLALWPRAWEELATEKSRLLRSLLDLEEDLRTGKIGEADYRSLKEGLEAELQKLGGLGAGEERLSL